ncbi:MAG TPA: 30S ribosomal protein S17 [bacterium]|jgi:small subunit ribosomal protein S17|nr:30S ribosomal protein S17 [bacterium]
MDERAKRKTRVGVVTSDKMQKTVVVKVQTTTRHPLYGKTLRKVRKFKAHNEDSAAKAGDTVLIAETRPLSKDKRWRVVRVLEKAR